MKVTVSLLVKMAYLLECNCFDCLSPINAASVTFRYHFEDKTKISQICVHYPCISSAASYGLALQEHFKFNELLNSNKP